MTPIAAVNGTALAVFGVIVAVTLVISWFASKRVNT
jgi:nitrogen fixation protein FixH